MVSDYFSYNSLIRTLGGGAALLAGAALGFITFGSFLLLFPHLIPVAIFAGIFGGVVEMEVFFSEVRMAFVNMFVVGPRRHAVRKVLEHWVKEKKQYGYKKLKTQEEKDKFLDALYACVFDSKTKVVLYDLVFYPDPHNTVHNKDYLVNIRQYLSPEDKTRLKRELRIKAPLLVLSGLAAIAAGIGFGALTFTQTAHVIAVLALGVSFATIASPPVWIILIAGTLGIIGGFAYGMQMYLMLETLLTYATPERARQSFVKLFLPHEKEKTWVYVLRSLLTLLVFMVVIAVTVVGCFFLAGAWFLGGQKCFAWLLKHSFSTVPKIATGASYVINSIAISVDGVFAIYNGVRGWEKVTQKVAKKWRLWQNPAHVNSTKNVILWSDLSLSAKIRRVNPALWLRRRCLFWGKLIILVLHLLAVGLIASAGVLFYPFLRGRVKVPSHYLGVILAAGIELFTDGNYLLEVVDPHDHSHKGHQHGHDHSHGHHEHHDHHDHHEHGAGDVCNHDHGLITDHFLYLVTIPLLVVATLWDCLCAPNWDWGQLKWSAKEMGVFKDCRLAVWIGEQFEGDVQHSAASSVGVAPSTMSRLCASLRAVGQPVTDELIALRQDLSALKSVSLWNVVFGEPDPSEADQSCAREETYGS